MFAGGDPTTRLDAMGNEDEVLRYYKGKLEIEKNSEKLLLIFRKLKIVRVTKKLLQTTGILDPLRSLRKQSGGVGIEAHKLVSSWKVVLNSTEGDKKHAAHHKSRSTGDGSSRTVNGLSGDSQLTDQSAKSDLKNDGEQLRHKISTSTDFLPLPIDASKIKREREHSERHYKISTATDVLHLPVDVSKIKREREHSERHHKIATTTEFLPLPVDASKIKKERGHSERHNKISTTTEFLPLPVDAPKPKRERGHSENLHSRSGTPVDSVDHSVANVNEAKNVKSVEIKRESSSNGASKAIAHTSKTDHQSRKHGNGQTEPKSTHRSRSGESRSDNKTAECRPDKKLEHDRRTSEGEPKKKNHRTHNSRGDKSGSDKKADRGHHGSSKKSSNGEQCSDSKSSTRVDGTMPSVEKSSSPSSSSRHPCKAEDRGSSSPGDSPKKYKSKERPTTADGKRDVSSKKSKKSLKRAPEDGFNATILSFEDCLGLNDMSATIPNPKRKKLNVTPPPKTSRSSSTAMANTTVKIKVEPGSCSSSSTYATVKIKVEPGSCSPSSTSPPVLNLPDILTRSVGEPPSHASIFATLPEIQPNYKPLRHSILDVSPKRKSGPEADSAAFMSSRHKRTQVFSGRRSAPMLSSITTLAECCVKVLKEFPEVMQRPFSSSWNFPPYFLLKPALERCNPVMLESIENLNDYLLDDSDELWQMHCHREFKGHEPEETETWRELYSKLGMEREVKFKRITAIISQAQAKKAPERKAIMAFVDGSVKPPRDVARQQVKFRTGGPPPREDRSKISSLAKVNQLKVGKTGAAMSNATSTSGITVSVPPPEPGPSNHGRGGNGSGIDAAQQKAKKVAPLMQKTLKFMKNRFRR